MIASVRHLSKDEWEIYRAATLFLEGRLDEWDAIAWALELTPKQQAERIAVSELLSGPKRMALEEPWSSAWRLILESWSSPPVELQPTLGAHYIQARLRDGEKSGALIADIVELVAPRLKVEKVSELRWKFEKKPRRPRSVSDLLSAQIDSGKLLDLGVLDLSRITDVRFLADLASALEAAVTSGIAISRRLGSGKDELYLRGGAVSRVYYTQPRDRDDDGEPDAYHTGIAPSVKLLHAVVSRIAAIDNPTALGFVRAWRHTTCSVKQRLWAAFARDPALASSAEVATFLHEIDDRRFWDLHMFPEIAELRASRFSDLDERARAGIEARVRKGPPRSFWPRRMPADKVAEATTYWAGRELKRIEIQAGALSKPSQAWLDKNAAQLAVLADMTAAEGLEEGIKVETIPSNPDEKYDLLAGDDRLRALESALGHERSGWGDDPASRAQDWLRQPGNTERILCDIEASESGGDKYPKVWNRFGWFHSPPEKANAGQDNSQEEAHRVLSQLAKLSAGTINQAIEGISNWLDRWGPFVVSSDQCWPLWRRVWPIAVRYTNATAREQKSPEPSVVSSEDGDISRMDIDTLNTPAGKLVGVFLQACPPLKADPNPFRDESALRPIRDQLIIADDRSGLIARCRLIAWLGYFMTADSEWAQQHLVAPLLKHDEQSQELWRALARGRTFSPKVLKIIGDAMVARACEPELGRETRGFLVFNLVIDSMYAFLDARDASVANSKILQMLRSLEDELRVRAARAVVEFMRDVPAYRKKTPADVFRKAAAPFLQKVWPLERSLATPGVSGAFADLPGLSGEAFAEAVDAVERFLVPFDTWSLLDYGLYGDQSGDGVPKLAMINNEDKARALLKLLDLTIGKTDGSLIPLDLANALDQIQSVSELLTKTRSYRRLSTAARR